jgi:tRNA(fMet)-specific endonuclease VapC
VLRGKKAFVEKLSRLSPDEVAVSIITVFELYAGVAKSQRSAEERSKVELFLKPLTLLVLGREEALVAAELRAVLEKKGLRIGSYDLLIAAHALSDGLGLATGNLSEFKRVPGLTVEDWAS